VYLYILLHSIRASKPSKPHGYAVFSFCGYSSVVEHQLPNNVVNNFKPNIITPET